MTRICIPKRAGLLPALHAASSGQCRADSNAYGIFRALMLWDGLLQMQMSYCLTLSLAFVSTSAPDFFEQGVRRKTLILSLVSSFLPLTSVPAATNSEQARTPWLLNKAKQV